jgi:NADPH:quinone reductase-like Zn-dependent oxidoreductase
VVALGAAQAIAPDDVAQHGPYDVVLELVGAASLPGAIAALGTGGRVAVIGVGSGAKVELNLLQLMGARARISGSTLRARDRHGKGAVVSAVGAHVLPLLAAGRLTVPVDETFPMADATAAYDRFAAGGKFGKLVLVAPG